jgi:hypothetical protein
MRIIECREIFCKASFPDNVGHHTINDYEFHYEDGYSNHKCEIKKIIVDRDGIIASRLLNEREFNSGDFHLFINEKDTIGHKLFIGVPDSKGRISKVGLHPFFDSENRDKILKKLKEEN